MTNVPEINIKRAVREAQKIVDLVGESRAYYKDAKVVKVEREGELTAKITLDNNHVEHWWGLQAQRVLANLESVEN